MAQLGLRTEPEQGRAARSVVTRVDTGGGERVVAIVAAADPGEIVEDPCCRGVGNLGDFAAQSRDL
jgi:hypothetical protein